MRKVSRQPSATSDSWIDWIAHAFGRVQCSVRSTVKIYTFLGVESCDSCDERRQTASVEFVSLFPARAPARSTDRPTRPRRPAGRPATCERVRHSFKHWSLLPTSTSATTTTATSLRRQLPHLLARSLAPVITLASIQLHASVSMFTQSFYEKRAIQIRGIFHHGLSSTIIN